MGLETLTAMCFLIDHYQTNKNNCWKKKQTLLLWLSVTLYDEFTTTFSANVHTQFVLNSEYESKFCRTDSERECDGLSKIRRNSTRFTLIAFTFARPEWTNRRMDERKRSAFDPLGVSVISIFLCAFVHRSNLHLEFYLLSYARPADTKLSFRDKNRLGQKNPPCKLFQKFTIKVKIIN